MSNNAQLKACKRAAFASKRPHEHHQEPRNAAPRYLPYSRRNHSAVPHHHPDNHNGNPSAGSGHFDSHWQIATSLGPDLHDDPFKRDGQSNSEFFGIWILADVIVKRESVCAVETTPDVREKPSRLRAKFLL